MGSFLQVKIEHFDSLSKTNYHHCLVINLFFTN